MANESKKTAPLENQVAEETGDQEEDLHPKAVAGVLEDFEYNVRIAVYNSPGIPFGTERFRCMEDDSQQERERPECIQCVIPLRNLIFQLHPQQDRKPRIISPGLLKSKDPRQPPTEDPMHAQPRCADRSPGILSESIHAPGTAGKIPGTHTNQPLKLLMGLKEMHPFSLEQGCHCFWINRYGQFHIDHGFM